MAIKYDTLGLLIYIALTANILAWVAMLSTHFPRRFRAIRWGVYPHVFVTRLTKIGWAFFALGFVASAGGVLMRGLSTGRPPMRNMFEVMMFIAAAMFPLSVFCRLVLRVGSSWADALLSAVLLVPVGFVFRRGWPLAADTAKSAVRPARSDVSISLRSPDQGSCAGGSLAADFTPRRHQPNAERTERRA